MVALGSEGLGDSSRQFKFLPQVLSINAFIKHQDQRQPQLEHDGTTEFSSMKSPTIGDNFKRGWIVLHQQDMEMAELPVPEGNEREDSSWVPQSIME